MKKADKHETSKNRRLVEEIEEMVVKVVPGVDRDRAEGNESHRGRAITGSLRGWDAFSRTGRT